jgi:hypothetical protein
MEITYYPNQNRRFSASFKHIEVKEGAMLASAYGNGETPELAVKDYVNKIRGKRIIKNAYLDNRQEFDVPKKITHEEPF